jgi:diguanylate cyclase (GGDEF)-like protein/PAS domain S-box-containing protein
MKKISLSRSFIFYIITAGLIGLSALFTFLFYNNLNIPLKIVIIAGLPASVLGLLTIYFHQTNKIHRENENLEKQLVRQTLIAKRKSRLANYFDRVLKDAADIIFTLDIDGYILKFNTGAETILGYRQHEIVGTPFSNMLLSPSEASTIFDGVLQEDRIQNRETQMKSKDGKTVDISLSISEMRDEKNQILGMVATCKDITEKKRLEMELLEKNALLEELAITDNLSGLFNVRHFHEEMREAFTRLKRNFYSSLTLLLVDIDKFKALNDTQGHQAGDVVIEKLGEIIRSCIRKDLDAAFRYGGDEFVVLLLDTVPQKGAVVAQRIISRYIKHKFGNTSLSVGIAEAQKTDNEESLVRRADQAMYEAKRTGGNRYKIYD